MDKLSTIIYDDLEKLKNKNIVIHGNLNSSKELIYVLKKMDINIIAVCSDSIKDWCIKYYQNIPIIRSTNFSEVIRKNSQLLIQPTNIDTNCLIQVIESEYDFEIDVSNIPMGLLNKNFSEFYLKNINENRRFLLKETRKWINKINRRFTMNLFDIYFKKHKSPIIMCLPMKTADYTLEKTFINYSNINYINFFHNPKFIYKKSFEKKLKVLKLITAVREPISQNISSLFQGISDGILYSDWILGELHNAKDDDIPNKIHNLNEILVNNKDDIQSLFDAYIERYIYSDSKKLSLLPRSMQKFILMFGKHVLDITKYPFNKEKGYTIIREGNIEVFVYQLEKLDFLLPELSEWIGIKFENWERRNVASNKWVGESYKEALKKIKISREYFEICFNDDYVKHCYSESDIENFKARWISHIKD